MFFKMVSFINKGTILTSATGPWHWLFLCPPRKSVHKLVHILGAPKKHPQIPEVALVDFTPIGANAHASLWVFYMYWYNSFVASYNSRLHIKKPAINFSVNFIPVYSNFRLVCCFTFLKFPAYCLSSWIHIYFNCT